MNEYYKQEIALIDQEVREGMLSKADAAVLKADLVEYMERDAAPRFSGLPWGESDDYEYEQF